MYRGIAHKVRRGDRSHLPLVTAAEMQSLDRRTIDEAKVKGTTLMERAGHGVVQVLERIFGPPAKMPITILCGKGNNGGDGLVIARLLKQMRARVVVVLLDTPHALTKDAQSMYRRLRKVSPSIIKVQPSDETLRTSIKEASLIIDALLGTGLSSDVRDPYYSAIQYTNDESVPCLAVDLPSGINSDTGKAMGIAIRAQATVTFGCPKIGLYLGEAINHAGQIITVDIGIPQQYVQELATSCFLLTPATISPLLPLREKDSHKGTFGHAGIIAGSSGKTGSAALAARATLRVGAGLVTVAIPKSVQPSLDAKLFEPMTQAMPETSTHTLSHNALIPLLQFSQNLTALAVGPGIGTDTETAELMSALLPQLRQPLVIDADALNILANDLSVLSTRKGPTILTPHPGEMARLVKQSSAKVINQDRLEIARQFAKKHEVILILKGARTVIANPDGETAICDTGNPGMASAGMGDALTGVIVGFLAQGLSPWHAACAGVCLHGLAGDMAAQTVGEHGLIATDLIEYLPRTLQSMYSQAQHP